MDKIEALEKIEQVWNDPKATLGDKITSISTSFYAVGLDLATTAAYIKATPAELDALLALSELDDDIIDRISMVEPPKTTWALLANANPDEIIQALNALDRMKKAHEVRQKDSPVSEFVYQQMLDVSGPTTEQRVAMLTGAELKHVLKKATDFNALSDKGKKLLSSIATQKRSGKVLSQKQIAVVISILNELAEKGVIKRDSIDGDEEICNKVLDAIGR